MTTTTCQHQSHEFHLSSENNNIQPLHGVSQKIDWLFPRFQSMPLNQFRGICNSMQTGKNHFQLIKTLTRIFVQHQWKINNLNLSKQSL